MFTVVGGNVPETMHLCPEQNQTCSFAAPPKGQKMTGIKNGLSALPCVQISPDP